MRACALLLLGSRVWGSCLSPRSALEPFEGRDQGCLSLSEPPPHSCMSREGGAGVTEGTPGGDLLDPDPTLRVQAFRRRHATRPVAAAFPELETWSVPKWQRAAGSMAPGPVFQGRVSGVRAPQGEMLPPRLGPWPAVFQLSVEPLRHLTPALPPPGLPQTCSTQWARENTSAPRVACVVTGNPQNSAGGAGCCRPGVCLPRPVGQREAGRRWAPQDAPAGPDKPDGAPGQGPGSRGSLGSSSLGPRIHLPRFTDEETDAERDTAHAGPEPSLEPGAPALGPLCTCPGAQMAAAAQEGWGGTLAPPACATGTNSRHYKASGCVCSGLQPWVGGCCSLAAQTLPPLVQVPQ